MHAAVQILVAALCLSSGVTATGRLQLKYSPEVNGIISVNYCTHTNFTNNEFYAMEDGMCTLPTWEWALPLRAAVGRNMTYNLHFNTTPTDIDLIYTMFKRGSEHRLIDKTRKHLLISREPTYFTMVTKKGAKIIASLQNICNDYFSGDDCSIYCRPNPAKNMECDDQRGKVCAQGFSGTHCDIENACSKGGCLDPKNCVLSDNIVGFECRKPDGSPETEFQIDHTYMSRKHKTEAEVQKDIDDYFNTEDSDLPNN